MSTTFLPRNKHSSTHEYIIYLEQCIKEELKDIKITEEKLEKIDKLKE